MPENMEIKARAANFAALLPRVADMADSAPTHVDQDDTFFTCPNGRFKLRVLSEGHGVLIFYQRADSPGPKPSFYVHSETSDPEGLRSVLALAWGETGRVRKHRLVFHIGQAEIHLDRVDGLGDFMELEIPVGEAFSADAAAAEAGRLTAAFGIRAEDLVTGSYCDLLAAAGAQARAQGEAPAPGAGMDF